MLFDTSEIKFRSQLLTSDTIGCINNAFSYMATKLPYHGQDGHIDFKSKVNEDKINTDKMRTQIHIFAPIIHSSLNKQLYTIYKMPVDVY